MRRLIAPAAVIGMLAIAGCSAPAPEPEETSAGVGKITTIDQLVDAAIDAGMVCNWEQTDVVSDAVASGACSDDTSLMMFGDSAATQNRADELAGLVKSPLLVGENWIINSSVGADLQPKLGGELVG